MQYEQGPEVAEGEMLAAERKKRREVMEAVEVPTRKKDEGAAKGKGVEGSTAAPGSAAAPSAHRVVSDEAVPISAAPQYKYQTPVEDPKLVHAVLDRALDVKIELLQRELLALSPDVRKQIKELTTTKRVAAGVYEATGYLGAEVLQGEVADGSTDEAVEVVAEECVDLRCLEGVVEGKCRVTCILDQGCQIIAISKAFWESLGVSLLTNRRINMTSANSTVERSLGLIPRLHIRFGLVELVVQAHVMPNAPFDVLLGRPFFQVGLCRTVDFANGEQHITITNPVLRQEITIPTQT